MAPRTGRIHECNRSRASCVCHIANAGRTIHETSTQTIQCHHRAKRTLSRPTFGVRVGGVSQSTCHPPQAVRGVSLGLIPSSGRGACLVEHLRQLLALLLGGPLTCDAMLVRPLIRIGVPRGEHLVVMAGDLGHRNRRCPAHAPATLANLIWSFHLTTFCLA